MRRQIADFWGIGPLKAATLREYLERPRVSWGLVKGDLPASDTWHLLISPLVKGKNTPNNNNNNHHHHHHHHHHHYHNCERKTITILILIVINNIRLNYYNIE